MKSNDEKKDDTSSITDEELRTTTDSVLKELLKSAPPMAPDGLPNESESTKNFVVPDYLIVEVARMKEVYPDASDEELANILKYS
jgi:hypothetical protein